MSVADFVVRIPRLAVAISEVTLTEVLVDEGGQVSEGSPLYVIESEKVDTEIDAGASGTVHWLVEVGASFDIGTAIAVISRPAS